ncbi:MAG: polyprenyl synthetase family protein [Bacillota bacterium]
MDLKAYLRERTDLVNRSLDIYLPGENEVPETIHKAMRYSIFAGGKRLRPILAIAAVESVGGDAEKVLPTACALEMVHTYSLIHDDLPALDDDDYRRGLLTCHKLFGEAMAILAGDALLTHAFILMAGTDNRAIVGSAQAVLDSMQDVSLAIGTGGMIGGQVADLEAERQERIEPDTLDYIHKHKTGALFRASVRVGAIIAGANDRQLLALTDYAENLGLAFQITDDILDIVGDSKKMGKSAGSDIKKGKATFPALYGLDKSRETVEVLTRRALDCLEPLGEPAEPLRQIAIYLTSRDS